MDMLNFSRPRFNFKGINFHYYMRLGILRVIGLYAIRLIFRLGGSLNWYIKNRRLNQMLRQKVEDIKKHHFKFDTSDVKDIDSIIKMDVTQLRSGLIEGRFTSLQLVNVFGERCQRIGKKLCLNSEVYYEQAIQMAKLRDAETEEARKLGADAMSKLPPMHGVPFSVKDSINLKGVLSTVGCSYLLDDPAKENAVIVDQYIRAGGIPLVKGNIPQTALGTDTNNFIYGHSKNPLDVTRSCGGSSGGNAGQIVSRCVPIGIGTDVGGSLRFPAAFCGIYGFKPTQERGSKRGATTCTKNRFSSWMHLRSCSGPMGTSVDDLVVGMRIQASADVHRLDPFAAPTPFRETDYAKAVEPSSFKGRKIGMLRMETNLKLTKSVQRAMDVAGEALKKLGFQVVEFAITREEVQTVKDCFYAMVANGMISGTAREAIKQGESLLGPQANNIRLMTGGKVDRILVDFVMRHLHNNKRGNDNIRNLRKMSEEEFEDVLKERYEFCHRFAQKWRDSGIEALISPIWPSCANKLETAAKLGLMLDYALIWNMTGFPAGAIPVTQVKESDLGDNYEDGFEDLWTDCLRENVKGSLNLPIGLQVIGYSYEDEQTLGVMKVLDGYLKSNPQ